MSFNFNEKKWSAEIKQPFWFSEVPALLEQLHKLRREKKEEYEKKKEIIYSFFQEKLLSNEVVLGSQNGDFDNERKNIDTIIIHHTSNQPGLTRERLSAIELFRLYAPYFADPKRNKFPDEQVHSGHVREGKQVFYPYHWMIHKDGTFEQLLTDQEIGWHSGNWDVNCRSIAICFDNDYEFGRPSHIELIAAVTLIKKRYPFIKKDRIIGHCEINMKTYCPSCLFLSKNNFKGWKEELLELYFNQ